MPDERAPDPVFDKLRAALNAPAPPTADVGWVGAAWAAGEADAIQERKREQYNAYEEALKREREAGQFKSATTATSPVESQFTFIALELQQSRLTGHAILRALEHLQQQGNRLMTITAETTAVLQRLNDATNRVATVVNDIRAQIKTGMTTEEVASVDAQLADVASHMEAIAADPENPVPAPLPEPGTDGVAAFRSNR